MPNDVHVVIYLDKDGRLKANPSTYDTPELAASGARLVSTVKRVEAWVMAFPDPRQVAND